MRKTTGLIIILFICVVLSVCSAAEREETLAIFTEVDKEKVEFGGRINVEVFTDNTGRFEVMFPDVPGQLGDFSFIKSYPLSTGSVKGYGSGMGYILGIYSTGTHVIPGIKIPYRKPGAPEIYNVYSQPVPIEVMSLLTGNDTDIKDIKGLVPLPSEILVLLIIILLLLTVILTSGIFLLVRKKHRQKMEQNKKILPPHEMAYMELSRLRARGLHEKGRVKEFYTVLSDVLRRYIERRFSYHAPEMTTQEFIEAMKLSSFLRTEAKKKLQEFLTHCDMIKFAGYSATQLEMLDSFRDVEDFVDQTRIVEDRGAEE